MLYLTYKWYTNKKVLNMDMYHGNFTVFKYHAIPCQKYCGRTIVLYIVQIVILWYFEKYHGTENDVTWHLHGTCPKYFLVVIIWYFHGNEIDVPWLYHTKATVILW